MDEIVFPRFDGRESSATAAANPSRAPIVKIQSSILRELYRRYFHKLVNDLRSTYGPGPPDPDDVAQAAFEKLSQRERLDDITNLESYVWIAARNIILSAKRSERVRTKNQNELENRWPGQSGDVFDPERVFIAEEQLQLVAKTLKTMPERRQRIFILNRIEGLTPKEAGEACGVSRTAAVRHIALATAAIAEVILSEGTVDSDTDS